MSDNERKRRVRCDRGRPLCSTCAHKGFICDGYQVLDPITKHVVRPPPSLLTPHEHQAYQYFMEVTLEWFNFDDLCYRNCRAREFWSSLVLPMSSSEIAVKETFVAISLIHRQMSLGDDHLGALSHYLRGLQAASTTTDETVALVCCVMLCVYEMFNRSYELFGTHMKWGLRVLKEYEKNAPLSGIVQDFVRPVLLAFHANSEEIILNKLLDVDDRSASQIVRMKQRRKRAIPAAS